MMPLGSPRRKNAAPAAIQTAVEDSNAYGTFGGAIPHRVSPRNNQRGIGRANGRLLKLVGVVGVFLFAASYMLTQYQSSSSGKTASLREAGTTHNSEKKTTKEVVEEVTAIPAQGFEKTFLEGVEPKKIREFLLQYASKPHSAGTEQDYETAVYTAKQFESFGIKAEIKEYYTLLSVPVRRRVAITAPANAVRELNLTEARVEDDACTTNEDALPPFLAYSASGNVSGSVVYVNYGRPEDYDWLIAQGVELKGKIALVRYGGNFRGLKVMGAEQHGMVGTLIYSDPKDDGYAVGKTYPEGLWRPGDSFQRGSAQYLSIYGGDPLTPGFASVKGAPYLTIEEATNIPHSPATVLSYGQAIHILKSLKGKKAPDAWQGALDLDGGYHVGDDGATQLNLDLEIDNKVGPIWDVIGTIEGAVEPDQLVLIGNHRDAWVCGAVDPSSGSAAMLEAARNFGELLKQGWKPRRTIKLASWDGEEYGLLGSTEYAEDQKDVLLKEAVAYLNVDAVMGPYVSAGGTPSIAEFIYNTAKTAPPNKFHGDEKEESLYQQWTAQSKAAIAKNPAIKKGTLEPDHLITLLGSGTDFTAFYQHLGIISANLGFSAGGGTYGVYHSTMDSPSYVAKFADPNYATESAVAQWWGLMAMRLATDAILPFDFSTYGLVMHKVLTSFEEQTKALKLDLDYSKLRDSINHFSANSELFHARLNDFSRAYKPSNTTDSVARTWNEKLVRAERQLILEEGLPHRPWYRHVIFGPGFFEGYAGTAFPGIADAIAFHDDSATTQAHIDDVAAVVKAAAEFLIVA
ncbi:hypothetical protein Poli38472_001093 [Pythium oligandrum]|uniref:Glutamate carboxypeptidase n=1 Tax=Pythium oligandrum TaxID=41045 RepID=A0A8K1CU89_PYTOL|nr:hypothetical protein Poli38472_001093 [Pythium oligandrum]|eukprot:TMW68937.1 hypothetical protein Poli38472_001093 [Pythium oligandrum]